MKLTVDTDNKKLILEEGGAVRELDLYTDESFEILSQQWVNLGWNQKYPYTFSWMGRPVIQLPEDMIRIQEVIYSVKPDVIVETGVAHGGSLIYYASLFKAMGKGRVIGVDIEIRPHNRKAIEEHELSSYLTLIEGSSVADDVVEQVKSLIKPGETVLVILDSNHTYAHVAEELRLYSPLVTKGSYIVSTDGVMKDVKDVPRAGKDWGVDNPSKAAIDFAAGNSQFVIEQPTWPFNESGLSKNITHWPDAWLKKV
ncbi:cephalosporin hydroxylase family protein [Pseudomonas sp. Gutcm_11s]|uniref:cephalosporin hydroxylase family protein n=1 Tax=Pseudomonas sp. Gutcm_11s TaxID=3026088 RepID=UPI002361F7EF|nr:CmcI family methyltransferase [Pseudomonas sp. Gutcm_11s]MDD0843875.1 CmcI family methyltransferase [Pseudomonas sp. Gutcm_11s]